MSLPFANVIPELVLTCPYCEMAKPISLWSPTGLSPQELNVGLLICSVCKGAYVPFVTGTMRRYRPVNGEPLTLFAE